MSNRLVVIANLFLSAAIVAFLFWLIYAFELGESGLTLPWLPAFNAACNATCATLLVLGYLRIRAGDRRGHIALMIGATTASAIFLVGYLVHHTLHGDTRFLGQGWLRPVYFGLLISHILLATITLPMVTTTLSFAALRRFTAHRAISRWTFPCWLYVSVTGVMVFGFLRFLNPA